MRNLILNHREGFLSKSVPIVITLALVLGLVGAFNVFAAGTPSSITITNINGYTAPFSFSCPANPLFSPVTISGSGQLGSNPPGQTSAYKIQVDWGDGVIENGIVPTVANDANNTYTFSAGSHTFTAGSSNSIKVRIYHQTPPGNDNQADSVATVPVCIQVPPPTNGSLTVTKIVNGGIAQVSDFTLKVDNTTVTSGVVTDFVADNYTVSENGGPTGYAGVMSGDCSADGSIAIVAGAHSDCTITNTFTPPIDVCPNIDGNQTTVPEGDQIDNNGDCVPIPPPPPGDIGSIKICKIITDTNGNVATSSVGLPSGLFSIVLAGATSTMNSPLHTAAFDATTFSPNEIILATSTLNDAQCVAYNNLPLTHYYYGQEGIIGSNWTPSYNDQVDHTVVSVADLFNYNSELFDFDQSNDGARNLNSDGDINLTVDRPNRILALLNTYSIITPPMTECSDGIDNDQDNKIDAADPACHTDENANNSESYNPSLNNESNDPTPPGTGGGGGGGGGGFSSGGGTGFVSGQGTVPASTIPSCSYLNDYLRIDLANNPAEVTKLQAFLRSLAGESNLQVTGIFDQATFDAVTRFQAKYGGDILSPWGYSEPTGYVYILTKKKINEIFCNAAFPVNGAEQSEIDSFRALLEGLRQAGISVPVGGTVTPEGQNVNPGNQVGEAGGVNGNQQASAIGALPVGGAPQTNDNSGVAAAGLSGTSISWGLWSLLVLVLAGASYYLFRKGKRS